MIIARECTRFSTDALRAACLATDERGVRYLEGWQLGPDGPQRELQVEVTCSPHVSQVVAVPDGRVVLSWHAPGRQLLDLVDRGGDRRSIGVTPAPIRLLPTPDRPGWLAVGIGVASAGTCTIYRIGESDGWLQPVATVAGDVRGGAVCGDRLVITVVASGRAVPMVVDLTRGAVSPLFDAEPTGHVLLAGGDRVLLAVDTAAGRRLALAPADGTAPMRTLHGPRGIGAALTPVAVDPTGSRVALVVTRGARSELALYHWPSDTVHPAGPTDGELYPVAAWPERGLWLPYSRPTEPPTFGWLASTQTGAFRPGPPPASPRAWHRGRLETFPGPAGDIESIVYGDWRSSPRVVVALHGGPESRWTIGFEPLFQAFAAHGLAVVAPNQRGSTGYGAQHVGAIVGSWGTCDLADVRAILGHLRRFRGPRAERPAVFGSSYGAFLALLAVAADPEAWSACAVVAPFRSAAALHREAGPATRSLIERLRGLVEATDEFGARDLDRLASRIRTKVFVLHGALDETIPVDQSRVLVDRLTAAGHPSVTYLEIADRGHNALSGPTAVPLIARIAQFLSGPDDVEPAAELVSAAGAAITPYGSGRR